MITTTVNKVQPNESQKLVLENGDELSVERYVLRRRVLISNECELLNPYRIKHKIKDFNLDDSIKPTLFRYAPNFNLLKSFDNLNELVKEKVNLDTPTKEYQNQEKLLLDEKDQQSYDCLKSKMNSYLVSIKFPSVNVRDSSPNIVVANKEEKTLDNINFGYINISLK